MERNIFGEYLKDLREAKGLLQAEVAEKINEKEEDIERWEKERSYPNLEAVYKLADIYDVSCDEMLRIREQSQKKNAKLSVFFANIVGRTYQVLSKLPVILILLLIIVAMMLLNRALQGLIMMIT